MSHSYKTISNSPEERRKKTFTWCYWDNAFTDEEINKIVKQMDSHKLEKGKTITLKNEKISKTRICNIKFINYDNETDWVFHKLNTVIENINNKFYNFDLNGYQNFQYTVYDSREKGKYDYHMDSHIGDNLNSHNEERKLSLTFLLNEPNVDFRGGEFQVNSGAEKNAETVELPKGRIILFPSFIIHRVKPVTYGTRKSIVVWVVGPKFR
jgi:PKHD-type hydroxylase